MKAQYSHSTYRGMVVVIDDEEDMCKILTKILNMEGYHVYAFTDPDRALIMLRNINPMLCLQISGCRIAPVWMY